MVTDLGIVYLQIIRVLGSERLLHRFKKKAWEARQCVSEKAVCKPVKVKLHMQRKFQKLGETMNIHLLQKLRGKQSPPKREAMRRAVTCNAVGARPLVPFGVHIHTATCCGSWACRHLPCSGWVLFWSHWFSSFCWFLPFGMEILTLCHLCWQCLTSFWYFKLSLS